MRGFFTPLVRISFGLVALTMSIIMGMSLLGLLPDEAQSELKVRSKMAEALAVQLAVAASIENTTVIQETIASVLKRNQVILSVGLRRADGEILTASKDHAVHWKDADAQKSTSTQVRVPLLNGDTPWGSVEIAFKPLSRAITLWGLPTRLIAILTVLGAFGLSGNYLILKRSLKELDPTKVIPDRVQAAFDTLVESVVILDNREQILLANQSFTKVVGEDFQSLVSKKLSSFQWRQWDDSEDFTDFPWRLVFRDQMSVSGAALGLRMESGEIRSFVVSASRIEEGKGRIIGAIVTFDDVTVLEKKNEDLLQTVHQLKNTEQEIKRQNSELQYLANHDPLSRCFNRRAFFARFEVKRAEAYRNNRHLACLMIDLDHFKRINDEFGHTIGDEVIANIGGILLSTFKGEDIVGRYGGEEFCVVINDLNAEASRQIAEVVRLMVAEKSGAWFDHKAHATASLGLAMLPPEPISVVDLVNRADQALYAAKENGRNQVVFWDGPGFEGANDDFSAPSPAVRAPSSSNAAATGEGIGDTRPESGSQTFAPIANANDIHEKIDTRFSYSDEKIFMNRVEDSIAQAKNANKSVAILQISLDSFERIFGLFGPALCENIAREVSARFSSVLRHSDTVSLVGGDRRKPSLSRVGEAKYLIEISDLEETSTVVWIVKRLFEKLDLPITVNRSDIFVTCSVGISLYPENGLDVQTLIARAGSAEHHARSKIGTNSFVFFSQELNDQSHQQMKLENGIRRALQKDEFALAYQPIIDAATAKVTAVEALLRCYNPELSGVPIDTVIAVAEQTNLILEVGDWVLRTAIAQMEHWQRAGLDLPIMSVNLSAVQICDAEAFERLLEQVSDVGFAQNRLQFELTETSALKNANSAAKLLRRAQKLGVRIVLDDFGTGFSSLTYLRCFQPDAIKIDRFFVKNIDSSYADAALVSAVVDMVKGLGIHVIAEGVETVEHMECLRDLGCTEIQGYLIAKPMPAAEMTEWLKMFVEGEDLAAEDMRQSA